MLSNRGVCRACRANFARRLGQHSGSPNNQASSSPSSPSLRQLSQSSFKPSSSYSRDQNGSSFRATRSSPLHQRNAHRPAISSNRIIFQAQLRFASTTNSPIATPISNSPVAASSTNNPINASNPNTPITSTNPPSSSVDVTTAAANPSDASTALPADIGQDLVGTLELDHWAIGYLQFQGIDFGWGPSSCIAWLFEHIHVLVGLPMGLSIGASIACTAVLLRLVSFPFVMTASDQNSRMQAMQSVVQPLTQKIRESGAARNTVQMMEARAKLSGVYRVANIQPWKVFLPILQLPIGFCSWRVVRAMVDLPVEGMRAGGWLWFKDLAVPDPFTGLPLIMAGTQALAIKLGGETGTQTQQSKQIRRSMQFGLPLISYFIVMWAPAAIALSFTSASILAVFTGMLMRNPGFRRLFNLAPIVKHQVQSAGAYQGTINIAPRAVTPTTTEAATASSFSPFGKVKKIATDAVSSVMPEAQKQKSAREKKRSLKVADKYEQARAKELQSEQKRNDDVRHQRFKGRN